MAFPGMPGMPGGAGAGNLTEQQMYEQQMVKYIQASMESCAGKSVLSGVMGAGLGGMFGLFMSSMRYDTPLSSPINPMNPANPSATTMPSIPLRQQLSAGFRDMGRSALSSAKNFGIIGTVFSGTECCIEGLRGKNDLYNGVAAGCITGGALAAKGGPQAVAFGCVGFAAFSAAIDAYMRLPEDDRRKEVI